MRFRTMFSVGILAMALLVVATAQANAPRVTQGDAEAMLQASATGGWAVNLHAGSVEGAPADFLPGSLARIAPNPPFDGRHYCSLDWHVIFSNSIDGTSAGDSRTKAEIRESLSQEDQILILDGAALDIARSPVKPFLNPGFFGLDEAYWYGVGRVMAPEDLSVGQHSLQVTFLTPGQPPFIGSPITFFIDAPGDGACL